MLFIGTAAVFAAIMPVFLQYLLSSRPHHNHLSHDVVMNLIMNSIFDFYFWAYPAMSSLISPLLPVCLNIFFESSSG